MVSARHFVAATGLAPPASPLDHEAERVVADFLRRRPGRFDFLELVAREAPADLEPRALAVALRRPLLRLARRLAGEERRDLAPIVADQLLDRALRGVFGYRQLAAIATRPPYPRRRKWRR